MEMPRMLARQYSSHSDWYRQWRDSSVLRNFRKFSGLETDLRVSWPASRFILT